MTRARRSGLQARRRGKTGRRAAAPPRDRSPDRTCLASPRGRAAPRDRTGAAPQATIVDEPASRDAAYDAVAAVAGATGGPSLLMLQCLLSLAFSPNVAAGRAHCPPKVRDEIVRHNLELSRAVYCVVQPHAPGQQAATAHLVHHPTEAIGLLALGGMWAREAAEVHTTRRLSKRAREILTQ